MNRCLILALGFCLTLTSSVRAELMSLEILKREPVFGRLFEKHPATIVTMPKGMGDR